ncbi:MAG TPA: pirin family protein [Planctomycetota bacterium]|nr:pirin family protein [Planctomycetota bacterium]
MITIRPSAERGHFDHGWLDTFHTFSFAEYHDEEHMGFRTLRVINEDRVAPQREFGTHGHRDMEIITYMLAGELAHQDSLGNGSTIRPGEVQRMSAGTGVMHSERNPGATEPAHLLQIWILPDRRGHEPSYEQKRFSDAERRGRLRLVASPDGAEGSVSIHQDSRLYSALLAPGESVRHALGAGRGAWVQVAKGAVTLEGGAAAAGDGRDGKPVRLSAGDGAGIEQETGVTLTAITPAEVLLFDLK